MFRTLGLLVAVSIAALGNTAANAALISGSIGMTIGAGGTITPAGGSLNSAFTITNATTIPGTGTGDWTAFGSLFVTNSMAFSAFDSNGGAFSFTDPNFGTFTGTVVGDTGQQPTVLGDQRAIGVLGTFTPGPALVGYTGSVNAGLQVILQDIVGAGRSASITFVTVPFENPPVPEPATSAIACMGLIGLAFAGRRAAAKKKQLA